jgi:hypothetical protein
LFLVAIRRPELREAHPAIQPTISEAVRRHYASLDRELNGREHFVEDLSRADIAFVPHLTSLGHLGEAVPGDCANLQAWLNRMLLRAARRDQALSAWERSATNPDPFFRTDRIHWRGERIEWALRLGLGTWLVREVEAGRAYFSPTPDDVTSAPSSRPRVDRDHRF